MSKRNLESDKMSCTVMYQPYAMSSYGVCDRPPAEKKAFRFPYVPSPPDSLHSDGSSYSHSSPGPSLPLSNTATNNHPTLPGNNSSLSLSRTLNPSSTSSTVTGNPRRPTSPQPQILGLGPFSSAPATITSATQLLQIQHNSHSSHLRSPHSMRQHHHSNNTATSNNSSSSASSASATITSHTHPHPHLLDAEEEPNNENEHQGATGNVNNRVQYLSANCVVYENYREETARVVEDHFARTIAEAESPTKCSVSMKARNFPPSFFNSNYQPQTSSKSFVNMGGYTASDFYGSAVDYGSTLSGLSHHHQPDPWHYPLTPHHQGYHHRATDLSYPPMPSTSRFNAAAAQYGSFFLAGAATSSAASRFASGAGQCGKGESSTWPAGLYHHPHDSIAELNLADYAAAAHYTSRTAAAGLETTAVGQEASGKDPYWF